MLPQAHPSSSLEAKLPTDLTKSELQKLRGRDWSAIREAWLSFVPSFPKLGALPDPSSDDLLEVLGFSAPTVTPFSTPTDHGNTRRGAVGISLPLPEGEMHECSGERIA